MRAAPNSAFGWIASTPTPPPKTTSIECDTLALPGPTDTLMAWWNNFERAWPALGARYDKRFYRMWRYYLLSCAGFFRSRQGQLWQLILSKRERRGIYRPE